MRSYRIIERDSRRRIVALRDSVLGKTSTPIVAVLGYDGETRRPTSIRVRGHTTFQRRHDDTYIVTRSQSGSPATSTATDVALNQRTGRLTWWDSTNGRSQADLYTGSGNTLGLKAFLVLCLVLVPPAWPLMLYILLSFVFEDACQRLDERIGSVLDFLTGAYRV